jgi:glucose-1-phosphate thymidylyltransferase
MKGIVLAGGTGSRLWPITHGVSKQLLPVYDKPMIHYPVATLMLAGIRKIAIITSPWDKESFKKVLGDGSRFGVEFKYLIQEHPRGIAEAFTISEEYISGDSCALILGDNLFHGVGLGRHLSEYSQIKGAQIFAYKVNDPERYGVVSFNQDGKIETLEEKPTNPKSSFAVPGLYFYDNQVFEITHSLKPSARNELEITAVNEAYLALNQLNVSILPSGTAWMDTGTFSSLHDASSYIRAIQERQGSKIGCLEEIAFKQGWITREELETIIADYQNTDFAKYLSDCLTNQE